MSKVIGPIDEKKIARMIRNWPYDHRLDWNSVCLGAQEILKWPAPPTRQGLNNKIAIKAAFSSKKNQLKISEQKSGAIRKPRSLMDAAKKIYRLQAENEQLKNELSRMAEAANRLIYNATIRGLTQQQLMAPLPTIRE